ncbi:MAG: histone [Candidatus Hadarchaeota archaeon]|nr:histone [Candidatus Hadarchaeota archaeon]
MPVFSLSVMSRLIRRGGSVRVSQSAALELSAVLESLGGEVAREAIRLMEHRGAKTVTQDDIKAAVKSCL